MKKRQKKTLMIIALISIFLCGFPGCFLLIAGFRFFPAALGTLNNFEDLISALAAGFLNGGWMVCLSGIFILIPFVLVLIAVLNRKKDVVLDVKEPTGISKDDPIPPAS